MPSEDLALAALTELEPAIKEALGFTRFYPECEDESQTWVRKQPLTIDDTDQYIRACDMTSAELILGLASADATGDTGADLSVEVVDDKWWIGNIIDSSESGEDQLIDLARTHLNQVYGLTRWDATNFPNMWNIDVNSSDIYVHVVGFVDRPGTPAGRVYVEFLREMRQIHDVPNPQV